jgi:hypothetical protein
MRSARAPGIREGVQAVEATTREGYPTMTGEVRYQVSLSYNRENKPAVEELARWLVRTGFQPWLDKWNLIPGEPWQETIEEAMVNCSTCAAFIGPQGHRFLTERRGAGCTLMHCRVLRQLQTNSQNGFALRSSRR